MRAQTQNKPPLFLRLLTGRVLSRKKNTPIPTDKKYVFIFSTGRTGTKYIAGYLNRFKKIHAVHEPKPSYRLRMWSIARYLNRVKDDYLFGVFLKLRGKQLQNVRDDIYIESNPFLSGFAIAIAKNLPNAYIIHVVRDPRDKITSSVNNKALRPSKRIMNSAVPYWHLPPYRPLNRKGKLIEKIARLWRATNEIISESSEHTNNYLLVKFEDFFKDTEKSMTNIMAFTGTKISPKKENKSGSVQVDRNASKLDDMTPWHSWSPQFTNKVDGILGESMKKYGYGEEGVWKNKIKNHKRKVNDRL